MILTISIAQSELEKYAGLELQLRDLSRIVNDAGSIKRFVPEPGKLVQFINLIARSGAIYEVY
jgi:hypothetical protein